MHSGRKGVIKIELERIGTKKMAKTVFLWTIQEDVVVQQELQYQSKVKPLSFFSVHSGK